jgi:predicted Zn-dependent protease
MSTGIISHCKFASLRSKRFDLQRAQYHSAPAHCLYAFSLLVPEKQFDQAFEEFRVALSLDPLSPIMNTNYATTLMDWRCSSDSAVEAPLASSDQLILLQINSYRFKSRFLVRFRFLE